MKKVALLMTLTLMIGAAPVPAEDYIGQILSSEDISPTVKFQDFDHVGHHSRGRALVVADFNNDGRPDSYIGNPGDASFVLLNVETEDGFEYEMVQLLFSDEDDVLAWGAQAADFDNDGDQDLFISGGGNECTAQDYLFRNLLMETGEVEFFDVTEWAGVGGRPQPNGEPIPMASANAAWADVNLDGWLDLFVNGNNRHTCQLPSDPTNLLWLSNGPQPVEGKPFTQVTFTDVTEDVGLDLTERPSRHSFFFDYDLDGDLDLYEMNFDDENVFWENRLLEDGVLSFVDISETLAGLADDIRFPLGSFAACPGDMNNDGLEDMVVFQRGETEGLTFDCSFEEADPHNGPQSNPESGGWPYPDNHAIFINQGIDVGTGDHLGFVNEAQTYAIDPALYEETAGVMGSQLGDLNGDGILDIFIGNGGPGMGQHDDLWMSQPLLPVTEPSYVDASAFVMDSTPPPFSLPEAPYRTHGTAILDVDRDGMTELLVLNGGPSHLDDSVREPNHLWEFELDSGYNFLRVQLEGGQPVNRDAIGSRVAVTASTNAESWTIHRTLYSGTCFSASNGLEIFFGLRNATAIDEVRVTWPDGEVTIVTDATLNSTLEVRKLP